MKNSVSVIIPALNEEKYIERCLKALFDMDLNGVDFEVLVVDNGSKDRTIEIVKTYPAKILEKKYVTISTLRNIGASNASGNILAFIDADCAVEKDWLLNALTVMNEKKASIVGCVYKVPEDSTWVGKTSDLIAKRRTTGEVNYLPGGNIMMKKSCFFDVNGFDESLTTNEDYDLCYRLREKGHTVYSDPSIKSVHYGTPNTVKHLFKRELWHGSSSFGIFLKEFRKFKNLKVVTFSLAIWAAILCSLAGLLIWFLTGGSGYFLASFTMLFMVIGMASLMVSVKQRCFRMIHYLFAYFFIYGFARGISIFKSIYGSFLK